MGSVSVVGEHLVAGFRHFIQQNEDSEEMRRVLKHMYQLVDRYLEVYETREEFAGFDECEDDL